MGHLSQPSVYNALKIRDVSGRERERENRYNALGVERK